MVKPVKLVSHFLEEIKTTCVKNVHRHLVEMSNVWKIKSGKHKKQEYGDQGNNP